MPGPLPPRARRGARWHASVLALASLPVTSPAWAGTEATHWPLPDAWEHFYEFGWTPDNSCTSVVGSPVVFRKVLDGEPVDLMVVLTKDSMWDFASEADPVDCDAVRDEVFHTEWLDQNPSRSGGRVLMVRLDDPSQVVALTGLGRDYYQAAVTSPTYDGVRDRLWLSAANGDRNPRHGLWSFDLSGLDSWPEGEMWLPLPERTIESPGDGGSTYSDSSPALLPGGQVVYGTMAAPEHPGSWEPGGYQGNLLLVDPLPGEDGSLPVFDRWSEDEGFRVWTAASPTVGPAGADGRWPVYVGAGTDYYPLVGEFGLGCHSVWGWYDPAGSDPLSLEGWHDPGDEGCRPIGPNVDDAPSGELAIAPDGTVWVASIGRASADEPYRFRHLDAELNLLCEVSTAVRSDAPTSNFYQGAGIDERGRAHLVANEYLGQVYLPRLYLVDGACSVLASVPLGTTGDTVFHTPVLGDAHTTAGSHYVFVAAGGGVGSLGPEPSRLHVFRVDGVGGVTELTELRATLHDRYDLPLSRPIFSSPVIWRRQIVVVAMDGTVNIVPGPSDLAGYLDSGWPRFRHDDWGSGHVRGGPYAPAAAPRGGRPSAPSTR